MKSSTPSTLRVLNKSLVLNVIRQHGPISRAQVAKKANMTRATVSDIVSVLLQEQAVYEGGAENSSVGRKGILLHYHADSGYGVAIDLGGTGISIALFNMNAELIAKMERFPTFPVQHRDEFISLLVRSIRDFIAQTGRPLHTLRVIGIGSPGIVDYQKGIAVEGSPNLPEWENLDLRARMQEAFDVPIVVENDVRAALIGELWKGQCQHAKDAVLINVGTGVGSALLMEGRLIRGSNHAAGEIGYMLLHREHLSQDWGNKGCYEMLISGSGLAERTRKSKDSNQAKWSSAAEIFKSAGDGDSEAVKIVEEFIDYLSIGVLNVLFTLNPQQIVMMGGITNSSDLFLDRLNENIRKHTFKHMAVEVTISELKELAPLYGIAILSMSTIEPDIQFLENIHLF